MRTVATEERSDTALVQAFRDGDADAFGQLYRRHAAAVAVTARGRGAAEHAVADVVQETFARAIVHLDGLRQPERFRPWLLAIARNATTDQLRRRVDDTMLDDDDARLATTEPSAAELLEVMELARIVRGCLAGLSVRDATVLTMVTQFGFGTSDVAVALGMSPGAAKVLLHRARRRLRAALIARTWAD